MGDAATLDVLASHDFTISNLDILGRQQKFSDGRTSYGMEKVHVIGIGGRAKAGKDTLVKFAKELFGNDKVYKISFADPLKQEAALYLSRAKDLNDLRSLLERLPFNYDKVRALCQQVLAFFIGEKEIPWGNYGYFLSLMYEEKIKSKYFRKYLQFWGTDLRRLGGDYISERFPVYEDPLTGCDLEPDKDYWTRKWLENYVNRPEGTILVCAADVRFPNEFEFLYNFGAEMVNLIRPIHPDEDYEECAKHESENALAMEMRWDTIIHNDGSVEDFRNAVYELLSKETEWKGCTHDRVVG